MGRASITQRRFRRRLKNAARRTVLRARDACLPSLDARADVGGPLAALIPAGLRLDPTAADRLAVARFVDHRFDLLGSGWVSLRHAMRCRGFEGIRFDMPSAGPYRDVVRANRAASLAARAGLSREYQPIDWQLDFKSGYRWSARTWYRDVRYGGVDAADVKVPWELSRMQHLPELAVAHSQDRDPQLAAEFRDQVLDWIAANPPRFGVNWACTMDVGIRVANWLLAFDLFKSTGARFAASFESSFASSVLAHAEHIVRNLEWDETRRANHYFGNIAGLLFAAAYLPARPQTDAWLLFAAQELMAETRRQFMDDGGHFEASTSYHRLCGEMIAVCAVLLSAVSAERIRKALAATPADVSWGPGLSRSAVARMAADFAATGSLLSAEFFRSLSCAAALTRSVTRADGSVAQIGDDDSGRLIRLGGWVEAGSVADCRAKYRNLDAFDGLPDDAPYVMQSAASHQQWLAWAGAALGRNDLLDPASSHVWRLPHALATSLAKVPAQARAAAAAPRSATQRQPDRADNAAGAQTYHVSGKHRGEGSDLFRNAVYEQYPQFGIYIVRSDRVHLVIRCGCAMNDAAGVHAHDDQLSFDLVVDGTHVAADPGTYVYTPCARQRNAYRSAHAHHAPSVQGSPSDCDRPIFGRPAQVEGYCIEFDAQRFVGWSTLSGGEVRRTISFHPDRIEVDDVYCLRAPWKPACGDTFQPATRLAFSPAYGVQLR